MQFLLLLCLFYWSCQCVSVREIFISEKGSDTPSCLERHSPLVSCRSLVNVSQHVTSDKLNNIVIMINDTNYTLLGVANFSGVENITITGKEDNSMTEITCNSSSTFDTGIVFDHSAVITLKSFTISHCGASIFSPNNLNFLTGNGTAIQIINCNRVNVSCIVVSRSISQGLTFINTGSTVQVVDSRFINNTVSRSHWFGGGGLQVIFYKTDNLKTITNYTILNSKFINNGNISDKDMKRNIAETLLCERGGAIRIVLLDHFFRDCSITLKNNTLEGNHAVFGGGAFVHVTRSTSNSKIKILNNSFLSNTVLVSGGGLEISYVAYGHTVPVNNTCSIINSSFINNTASSGGGLFTYSSSIRHHINHTDQYNKLSCKNCLFEGNSAPCGAAVSVTCGLFSKKGTKSINRVFFNECIFKNNMVITKSNVDSNGAFFISKVGVTFTDTTDFTGNDGTALYLDSNDDLKTVATFNAGSRVYFRRNTGYKGGAIVLSGNSALYIHCDDYSSFYFLSNTATMFSGAICALTNRIIFETPNIYEKTCFLTLQEHWPKNVSFYFHNNSASIGYSDVYTTSIEPCYNSCNRTIKDSNASHFFETKCLGNFNFTGSRKNVATSPKNYTIQFEGVVFPGIENSLKLVQYDEFGDDVSQLFPFIARVQSSRENAKVAYYHNNSIMVVGYPGDEGELLLESSTYTLTARFNLSFCGPGFEFHNESLKCTCSKNYKSIQCENKSAAIASNYWAGYINDTTPDHLLTGLCVTELCNPDNCYGQPTCSLPPMADEQALEKQICGDSRHGRLCGRCDDNTSVYYHSASYTCGNNTSCSYGIPIYIVSELLPVTIIFLIILLFNIRITSGAVYSFVLYIQILSRINITAFKTIHIEDRFTQYAVDFFQIVIGVFSFEIRSGGFCMFQTNTIMNLLMIQYATLAYAFFLVLGTILFMRIHSCYSCVKLCRRCGRRNIRGSIVDGLSAFLVLCYFQCAAITSCILTPSYIYKYHEWYTTAPMFDGELDYLKGDHLWYAMPAFLCIIFILIPPPTILILEPILTKLFSMDCFTRTPPKWYYDKLRMKLMPFLDSFQACFKDRHRYFAGLYFLYRLLFITIASIIVQGPQYYYGLVISLFMFIVPLHAFIQPYKKKWHELLEMSLFIIIISLLMITLYNFAFNRSNGTRLIIVQLILITISIGCMMVYIAIKIYQKLSALKMKNETSASHECIDVSDSLPYRLLNNDNNENENNSYRTF